MGIGSCGTMRPQRLRSRIFADITPVSWNELSIGSNGLSGRYVQSSQEEWLEEGVKPKHTLEKNIHSRMI
jgi:hypothetical protein